MLPKHYKTSFFLKTRLFDNLTCFAELEDRISKLPTTVDIGDAFEVFAEAYFFTQKIEQAEEVWPFKSIPSGIKENLSLGNNQQDNGVDGVYKTTSNTFNAYQAKFRKGRPSLTWREISTFMGLTDNVRQRVLFTNSNDITSVINERTGFHCIRGNDLDRLEKSDFETILKWLQSGEVEVERKTPLPHQKEAIEDILSTLKDEDRATALMACGTGKTLVALWVSEQMDCKNTLVLLPSLTLVRQTLHEWLKETKWQHISYLCVCSDPTVASKELDSIKINQSDLDFAVTTESSTVKQFLSQNTEGVKIVFSTYQSAHIVAEGMDNIHRFDLGIFDEAHKTAGREGKKFGFALKDDNLCSKKRLFLTATPRHYNINKKNEEGNFDLVYSMDNSDVYGKVAHELSFAKAAHQDIICNYKVIISVVTSEQVSKELLKRGEVIINGDVVNAQLVAHQIAFRDAINKYNIKRVFTFHKSINTAKSFTGKGSEGIRRHLPKFNTFHVNGTMSTAAREGVMNEFKNSDCSVISNARCLTEGVDLPAVDLVAFMSPKKSKVDIVQATGRAMRKDPQNPDKTYGYILVPLYLEMATEERIEDAVDKTDFGEVWNILQAMQEQDEVLADTIRLMQENKGRHRKQKSDDFGDKIDFFGVDISLKTIKESITAVCTDKLSNTWDLRYGELIQYKEIFGDCNVPSNWNENKQLAIWVGTQRSNYTYKLLSKDHIKRLEDIGFAWHADNSLLRKHHEKKWGEMFEALTTYKNMYEDCNVPNGWPDKKLVGWVSRQRTEYRTENLSNERIESLESIGFEWVSPFKKAEEERQKKLWHEKLKTLITYKNMYGNCNVPNSWPDKKLVNWVATQRAKYRTESLSNERIESLESIGFEWVSPLKEAKEEIQKKLWHEKLKTLITYKNLYGNCNVPKSWPDKKLVNWVAAQRTKYRTENLSNERIESLESIGFEWVPHKKKQDSYNIRKTSVRNIKTWVQMLDELKKYKEDHGNCNVSASWHLGQWANTQRAKYRKGELSGDHIKQLDDIGFEWDIRK
ncbi:helicase [Candidatus Scalindua japonica]|uniref:Helicase n=1 Tax=Candidatus Scalindua japonica TaxID=1284222 RepID=A0A286U2L5_9BACT|nr:DEAD/DEAH box helicase [Candidatus Scalindua japonica]GAX62365.1 helicase [Candidatus Scalindua japonica]